MSMQRAAFTSMSSQRVCYFPLFSSEILLKYIEFRYDNNWNDVCWWLVSQNMPKWQESWLKCSSVILAVRTWAIWGRQTILGWALGIFLAVILVPSCIEDAKTLSSMTCAYWTSQSLRSILTILFTSCASSRNITELLRVFSNCY